MIVVTEKQRFIKALRREPIKGHVPTFELVFYLTLEAVGRVHPDHRRYNQWNQMSEKEKRLQLSDMADSFLDVAKKYGHSAIFVHPNPNDFENIVRILETIREKSGDEYFLMLHGDPTFSMPNGENMLEFTRRLYEDGESLKKEASERLEMRLDFAEKMLKYPGLIDGFALCSDYCFNVNPFFTPEMFSEFIAPYLQKVLEGYRSMGYYSIKHTDGNIMPIADQMVQCGPDALHSLDPQGGVDLKEMRRLYSDKVCLIGNVNCGLLQTGTREQCEADVRRSLREGMEGYGYIFSTSNCAYTGLSLDRYELMNSIWRREGIYK